MSVRGAWGGHHGAVTPGTVLGASLQRALPPHRGWGRGDGGVRAPHAGAWGCSLCAQVPPSKPRRVGGVQGGLHSFCLQACLSGRARADLCIVSKRSPALSHANAALKAARCQTDEIVALFSLLRDGRRGKGPQRAQPALWGGGHRLSPHPPPRPCISTPAWPEQGAKRTRSEWGFAGFIHQGLQHVPMLGCQAVGWHLGGAGATSPRSGTRPGSPGDSSPFLRLRGVSGAGAGRTKSGNLWKDKRICPGSVKQAKADKRGSLWKRQQLGLVCGNLERPAPAQPAFMNY